MHRRSAIIAILALLALAVAAAWVLQSRVPAPPTATGPYHVRVTRDGRELASFDLAALEAVGMKKIVLQGKAQHGPALLDVLRKAGVTEFSGIDVVGAGADDSGRLSLSRSEIGPDVVLAVANRGTVKIAGPDISMEMRVRDVTELVVR